MPFTDFPLEILHLIATEVADQHPTDLANLALVNKQCFAVCRPLISAVPYREIQIRLRVYGSNKNTSAAIVNLTELLTDAHALAYVRRLRIDSDENPYVSWAGDRHSRDWNPPKFTDFKPRHAGRLNDPMEDVFNYLYGDRGRFFDFPRLNVAGIDLPHLSDDFDRMPDRKMQQIYEWALISILVDKLPNLEDIIYMALDPLPSDFLDKLHNQKPRCRLHLHALVLMTKSTNRFPVVGLYDRKLLTSPLLYSVVLADDCLDETDFSRVPDTANPAQGNQFPVGAEILQALRQAPNLSHIYLRPTIEEDPDPFPIRSFRNNPLPHSKSRALRELHFHDLTHITPQTISGWQTQFDFSQLEALRLHAPVYEGYFVEQCEYFLMFRDLICRDSVFSGLKVLELDLGCNTDHYDDDGRYYSVIQQCIESLPPLRELTLDHWGKMIPLQSIVQTHGATLRKLALKYDRKPHDLCCLFAPDIDLLASGCPLLEDLSCKVRRRYGGPSEVAVYRALGAIRRLRYLTLHMVVSYASWRDGDVGSALSARRYVPLEERSQCWRHSSPLDGCEDCNDSPITARGPTSWTTNDSRKCSWGRHEARDGDVKQFMIDSALSDTLVCAIFREIASAKPEASPRLEVMSIHVDEYEPICIFPTSWRVESRLRFQAPFEVIAWEILLGDSEATRAIRRRRRRPLSEDWERVFKSIWPDVTSEARERRLLRATAGSNPEPQLHNERSNEGGDYNWWTKWFSFPLCPE